MISPVGTVVGSLAGSVVEVLAGAGVGPLSGSGVGALVGTGVGSLVDSGVEACELHTAGNNAHRGESEGMGAGMGVGSELQPHDAWEHQAGMLTATPSSCAARAPATAARGACGAMTRARPAGQSSCAACLP